MIAWLRRQTDKFAHLGIGALAGTAALLLPVEDKALVTIAAATVAGVAIEAYQRATNSGAVEFFDAVATVAGGTLIALALLLGGCAPQQGGVQLVGCIDGNEWAAFREYCLAPSGEWDPVACREVRIDLQCDAAPNAIIMIGDDDG